MNKELYKQVYWLKYLAIVLIQKSLIVKDEALMGPMLYFFTLLYKTGMICPLSHLQHCKHMSPENN